MLPPPRTTAISTSRSCTVLICWAIALTVSGSVPYSRSPMSASPESFRRMRSKAGAKGLRPHLEAGEAADDDVLAGLTGQLGPDLLDRLAVVLVGVDVGLVEQDDVLHPGLELALGDLRAHVLGLVGGLALEHAQLRLPVRIRDLLLGDVAGERAGGDVERDVAGEGHEVVVAGDEVGVAVDLDEHADLGVAVDVGLDRALGGLAAADLQRLVAEADAQQLDRGVDVAARLLEGALAVHHAGARAVAQLLDLRGGDVRGAHLSSSFSLSLSATASATVPAAALAARATPLSGPGATFSTASAAPSATCAAPSATSCAVSTAVFPAPWTWSTRLASSSPASSPAASAGASSAGASSAGASSAGGASAGVASAAGASSPLAAAACSASTAATPWAAASSAAGSSAGAASRAASAAELGPGSGAAAASFLVLRAR